jgi:hypothetical protein
MMINRCRGIYNATHTDNGIRLDNRSGAYNGTRLQVGSWAYKCPGMDQYCKLPAIFNNLGAQSDTCVIITQGDKELIS